MPASKFPCLEHTYLLQLSSLARRLPPPGRCSRSPPRPRLPQSCFSSDGAGATPGGRRGPGRPQPSRTRGMRALAPAFPPSPREPPLPACPARRRLPGARGDWWERSQWRVQALPGGRASSRPPPGAFEKVARCAGAPSSSGGRVWPGPARRGPRCRGGEAGLRRERGFGCPRRCRARPSQGSGSGCSRGSRSDGAGGRAEARLSPLGWGAGGEPCACCCSPSGVGALSSFPHSR